MDFLCYFIIPFTVLVLYQIKTGANDVCHRFDIFLAKPAKWSFNSLVNTILHWISSNSFFCCSTNKTFRLPFQLSFPQPHHFLRSFWNYVYLTNCSYNAFSFHSFSRFSFFPSCSHWQCTFPIEFSCCSLEQGLPHEWGIMNEPSSNIYWFSYSYSFWWLPSLWEVGFLHRVIFLYSHFAPLAKVLDFLDIHTGYLL